MKVKILLSLMLLMNFAAFSQFNEIAVRAGFSESTPPQASNFRPGISAGLEFLYAFSKQFSLRSGLGHDYKFTRSNHQDLQTEYRYYMLSVPAYINYNISRLNIFAGPSVKYLYRQLVYSKGEYYYDHIDPESGSIVTEHVVVDEKEVIKEIEKRINIGLGLGLSVDIPLNENFRILLDLRGDMDLLKERYRFISGTISGGVVYKLR